jgi:hypothetical protein
VSDCVIITAGVASVLAVSRQTRVSDCFIITVSVA